MSEEEGTFEAAEGMTVEIETVTITIAEKCTDTLAGGHWLCITHVEAFPHNWAMQAHTASGYHVIAWHCDAHGPEVP